MAVARQPIPRVYGTPRSRRARTSSRLRTLPWPIDISPVPVAAGAALACIVYLWGCAQVTQANYEKVRLNEQLQDLLTQRHAMDTAVTTTTSKEAVEKWARLHGMVPSTDCIYLGRGQEGM